MIGIVVFAFGLESQEPSFSNAILAEVANRLSLDCEKHGEETAIAAQWECALDIPTSQLVIGPYLDRYLSSADVVHEAAPLFRRKGIERVVAIAKPGPHLWLSRRLLRRAGFQVINHAVGPVPYSPTSLQAWTRSAPAFYTHAIQRAMGRHPEQNIVTTQMRQLAQTKSAP